MLMNFKLLSVGAIALALFVLSAPTLSAKDDDAPKHDGKVVSVSGDTIVMTNKDDKDGKEHSHTLSADAKVTLDGMACKAEDLKAGMRIRVTTKKDDKKVATHVEALDKNPGFGSK